jgi:hypothetical protein
LGTRLQGTRCGAIRGGINRRGVGGAKGGDRRCHGREHQRGRERAIGRCSYSRALARPSLFRSARSLVGSPRSKSGFQPRAFSRGDLPQRRSVFGACRSRRTTSAPRSASRWGVAASAKASMTAALSLAMIFFGVSFGAQIALQTDVWNPGQSGLVRRPDIQGCCQAISARERIGFDVAGCGSEVTWSATIISI